MPRQLQRSFGFLSLLLFAGNAFAGLSCDPAASLRSQARECADNLAYSRAAKACLDRFTKEVQDAQGALASSLAALANPDKQKQSEANAKSGYRKASATLDELRATGRSLQRQVKGYKTEVVWPEDFDSATSAGLSAESMLRNFPCYTDTQELLDTYVKIFDAQLEQLRLTKEIAGVLEKKSGGREAALSPEEILRKFQNAPKGTKGPGSGAGKKSGNGKSDITGTPEDEAKRKKAQGQ